MNSMTGFGRSVASTPLGRITVEIASVNNRFLEMSFRLPRPYVALEPLIREYLGSVLNRGKLNVFVAIDEVVSSSDRYTINDTAAKAYLKKLTKIQKELKLSGEVSISDIISLPDVVRTESLEIDIEAAWKVFHQPLEKAAAVLIKMRAREGKAMAVDMKGRLKEMSGLNKIVKTKTADSVKFYSTKLHDRIEELLGNTLRDKTRLEEEVAIFADKTDICEEVVRLQTHIDEYKSAMKSPEAVGRKLNFILQEMNREANTIGSKSADFGISATVISLKEEIEKLREMIQNVE